MAQSDQYKSENGFIIFILYILQTITVSVEVFIRYKMGERYMTIIRSILLLFFFLLFTVSMDFFIDAFNTFLMGVFIATSLALSLVHAIKAKRRPSKNIEIHSYYNGIPLLQTLFPNQSETIVKTYIEPLFLLLLGVFLFVLGRYKIYPFYGIGLYITVVSLIFFVKSQIEYSIGRSRYLDIIDKKIEGEMLKDAIQGKNAAETKGFSLPVPKTMKPAARQNVEQMYRTLDPALQRLMSKSTEKEPVVELSKSFVETSRELPKDRDEENEITRD